MNNSISNAEVMNLNETVSTKKTRKYNVQPVYAVLSKARAQFLRQVTQNTEIKRACIERNIIFNYDDSLRFWLELKNEANDLLDSMKFNEYCKKNSLDQEAVAEHIIFEGKATKKAVLKNGLETLGEKCRMFNERLFIEDEKLLPPTAEQDSETTESAE